MERILEIDALQEVSNAVVEAARETLVIGETQTRSALRHIGAQTQRHFAEDSS
jgi:hypothetical protein